MADEHVNCPDCGTPLLDLERRLELDDRSHRHHPSDCVKILKSAFETERAAKRGFATALLDFVEVGRWLAELQPAIVSRTQQEADVWAKWYRLLHEAPVVTKDDLDAAVKRAQEASGGTENER